MAFPARLKKGHQVGHLSRRGLIFGVVVVGICLVANGGVLSLFADPHAFERHFHLVNRVDLETILKAEVFVKEGDFQVRAAHKILGYDPIQKSFSAPKYVIKAKDPQLHRITVAEHGFLLPEGSSTQGGATLAGSSSSQ